MRDIQKGDKVYIVRHARQSEVVICKTVDKVRTDYPYYHDGRAIICEGTAYLPKNVYLSKDEAKTRLIDELQERIDKIKAL